MTELEQLYEQIWMERPHRCAVCGYPISRPIRHVFSHVYSKGAHPSLKLVKLNIELWCSTLIRTDDKRGCHELHHTNPYAFERRASENDYEKPDLRELKSQITTSP